MVFPMHVDKISMELPILYLKGSQVGISKLRFVYVLKGCFLIILANSVDTDEVHIMCFFTWVFTDCFH